MAKIPIRKIKKATVLTKRTQCLRKYYTERSYKPLYEKLKSNNIYLAKALSHEKENNQSLFTQNLALIGEIQELRLGHNTQDNIITNVLSNTKEMLKMLVNISGYMTNTISICQEYVASNTTIRLSSNSSERKNSSSRFSMKSPTKGVVKPMVSGHTITKPTINLSRVNIENINMGASRLSDIQEVSTSDISSADTSRINEDSEDGPIAGALAMSPLRYENGSVRRMPERLVVPSPRLSDTLMINNKRRVKRRKNHSKLPESFSQSDRWSDETPRSSAEHINQLGSLTVQLNDVSKLLRNAHSINIKRLINNVDEQANDNDAHHDVTSEKNVIIPETQISINLDEEDEACAPGSEKDSNVQTINKAKQSNMTENLKAFQNNVWEEDPLEGPSWLFNNTVAVPSRDDEPEESSHLHVSDFNNNTSNVIEEYNDDNVTENNIEDTLAPLENLMETNNSVTLEKNAAPIPTVKFESSYLNHVDDVDDVDDNSFCAVLPSVRLSQRRLDNVEDDIVNQASFVTFKRGTCENVEDETEDFTLMLTRQPIRNMHFDINDLRLPSPEPPVNSNVDGCGIEQVAMSNVTNVLASNQDQDEDITSPEHAMKIPLSLIRNHERMLTLQKSKNNLNKKPTETPSLKHTTAEQAEENPTTNGEANKKRKSEKSRDPSMAKVVLEKLKSHVKQRIDDAESQNANNDVEVRRSNTSNQMDNLENAEDNMNRNNRPRRRKAPKNLKEPNMKKKLRQERTK